MTDFASYFDELDCLLDDGRRPSLDEVLTEARAACVEHAAATIEHDQLEAAERQSYQRCFDLKARYERAVRWLPDALKEPAS